VNLRDAGVGEVQAQRVLVSAVAEEVRAGDVGDVASSIAQIHEGMSTLREIFAQALAK